MLAVLLLLLIYCQRHLRFLNVARQIKLYQASEVLQTIFNL